jgi:hypothetical protein
MAIEIIDVRTSFAGTITVKVKNTVTGKIGSGNSYPLPGRRTEADALEEAKNIAIRDAQ